jgi:hypothetical protein
MMCGGCVTRVKGLLEEQLQVVQVLLHKKNKN